MRLALTIGDPAGIGPEISLQMLMQSPPPVPIVLIGCAKLLQRVATTLRLNIDLPVFSKGELLANPPDGHAILDLPVEGLADLVPGIASPLSGQAAYHWLTEAIDLTLAGHFDALVTAPLCKEALYLGGHFYDGHTEILVERTGTAHHAMMLTSPDITATLVTTHIALGEVARKLTVERILEVTRLSATALPALRGKAKPRLAVLGLNPHAGENGLFGSEEATIIQPAIDILRGEGLDLIGPLPSDTAFIPAIRSEVDGYIAMYHDQGLIPLKTLAFDHAVNVTLGLPIIRTSVDHGTAFDIAWQGIAQTSSLQAACDAAIRLAENS